MIFCSFRELFCEIAQLVKWDQMSETSAKKHKKLRNKKVGNEIYLTKKNSEILHPTIVG